MVATDHGPCMVGSEAASYKFRSSLEWQLELVRRTVRHGVSIFQILQVSLGMTATVFGMTEFMIHGATIAHPVIGSYRAIRLGNSAAADLCIRIDLGGRLFDIRTEHIQLVPVQGFKMDNTAHGLVIFGDAVRSAIRGYFRPMNTG